MSPNVTRSNSSLFVILQLNDNQEKKDEEQPKPRVSSQEDINLLLAFSSTDCTSYNWVSV